jgi:hypothetical protein
MNGGRNTGFGKAQSLNTMLLVVLGNATHSEFPLSKQHSDKVTCKLHVKSENL